MSQQYRSLREVWARNHCWPNWEGRCWVTGASSAGSSGLHYVRFELGGQAGAAGQGAQVLLSLHHHNREPRPCLVLPEQPFGVGARVGLRLTGTGKALPPQPHYSRQLLARQLLEASVSGQRKITDVHVLALGVSVDCIAQRAWWTATPQSLARTSGWS